MTPEKKHGKPPIVLGRSDHDALARLADSISAKNPVVADQLFSELERARVVSDRQLRPDVVRMNSTLSFTTDAGENRTVTLVFPGEADIAAGKVSILTPIGAALIGLSVGQSIDWTGRDGRVHRLKVEGLEKGSGVVPARRSGSEARVS